MTEKEVINYYKKVMQIHKDEFGDDQKAVDLYNTTINALQKLRQYREIGTIDDFKRLDYLQKRYEDETYDFCGEFGTEECELKNQIERLRKYETIGTPEECQEMKERQEAKQPYIWGAWDDAIPDMYDCPNCGESYGIGTDDYDHCPRCGQAFDKSDLAKQYE